MDERNAKYRSVRNTLTSAASAHPEGRGLDRMDSTKKGEKKDPGVPKEKLPSSSVVVAGGVDNEGGHRSGA